MPILLSKNGLCMWIPTYPFVQNDVFLKVSYVLYIWGFVDMYLTHVETRTWSPLIHIYSKKWFFLPPKHCCIPWAQEKRTFFPTLNVMILQMVRNECVRFGGYVEVPVSYKILWLETPKKGPNFAQFALLSRGVVTRQLWTQHRLRCLGVKISALFWACSQPLSMQ
jgi:hypothetical protein